MKKVYSTLNQVIYTSQVENGPSSTWDTKQSSQSFYKVYIKPYVKAKQAGQKNLIDYTLPYKWLNGTKMGAYMTKTNNYYFWLHDGTMIGIETDVNTKGNLLFHVDLNGCDKGPNMAGHDYFCFVKRNNDAKVRPCGGDNCIKGGVGSSCASQIAKDGWQIKYN